MALVRRLSSDVRYSKGCPKWIPPESLARERVGCVRRIHSGRFKRFRTNDLQLEESKDKEFGRSETDLAPHVGFEPTQNGIRFAHRSSREHGRTAGART